MSKYFGALLQCEHVTCIRDIQHQKAKAKIKILATSLVAIKSSYFKCNALFLQCLAVRFFLIIINAYFNQRSFWEQNILDFALVQ